MAFSRRALFHALDPVMDSLCDVGFLNGCVPPRFFHKLFAYNLLLLYSDQSSKRLGQPTNPMNE